MTHTSSSGPSRRESASSPWPPWRTVVAFGSVSLAADMVYEGMRALSGPFLGSLGASALVVGAVTGAGEAVALLLRLVTGVWADRTRSYWKLTVLGYAMTAISVPLLAVAPFLGSAGLILAAALILAERTGKAIRSPAKSVLLARMTSPTTKGRAFGLHKALDQVGALAGPLLLAAMASLTGRLWPGFAVLAIPGAAALFLLGQLRRHSPPTDEGADEAPTPPTRSLASAVLFATFGRHLPRTFHLFALSVALTTAGLMTFGVISYRFVAEGLVAPAAVPLLYAAAMATQAVTALAAGVLFDRWGGRVLVVVPIMVIGVPLCVFSDQVWLVLVGLILWGAATGIQDSTAKAYVVDVVTAQERATAYGVFAAIQGLGALGGGVVAGWLALGHADELSVVIGVLQVAAVALLWGTLRTHTAGRELEDPR